MPFKLFVLLRVPISVCCLLGYIVASIFVSDRAWYPLLGFVLLLGPYGFLAVATIKLVRLRPDALSFAWCLLALETLGASLLVDTYEYIADESIDWLMAFAVTCVVVVVWVLPNVAILYKARGLFAAKEKPGL